MTEYPDELKKLLAIASDLGFSAELRLKSIEIMGNMGTHEALLALFELAANEGIAREERELSLKYTRDIIRSGR